MYDELTRSTRGPSLRFVLNEYDLVVVGEEREGKGEEKEKKR